MRQQELYSESRFTQDGPLGVPLFRISSLILTRNRVGFYSSPRIGDSKASLAILHTLTAESEGLAEWSTVGNVVLNYRLTSATVESVAVLSNRLTRHRHQSWVVRA